MRLFLLSDLHFGRANPDLVTPLLETIATAQPDHVIIAGDFVQRARASHFAPARDFLDRLTVPWLAVPGNHDLPLYNILERLRTPRAAYRHWIAEQTEPDLLTPDAAIVGIDTTHRWHHQRGLVRPAQIERVAAAIRENAADRAVVVVAHHPFHHAADIEKKLMLHAPKALDIWAEAGPHILLTGHLHRWMVEPFVTSKNQSMTLQVHCGTGLSTRLRGEPNDCAILEVTPGQLRIARLTVPEGAADFTQAESVVYQITEGGWVRADGLPEGN